MLSYKLIQLIEDHWELITDEVIERIRKEPELSHISQLPKSELKDWGRGILKNLGHWLEGRDEGLARHYERLGRLRFEEGVPLHESVWALFQLKDHMVEFVREQGLPHSAVEIYAEEELEHRVGRFFDWLVWHLVRGYEHALREAGDLGINKSHSVRQLASY